MNKVREIFPADDFKTVLENAKRDIEAGLIIGYDEHGELVVYGGGLIDGRRPVTRDWLWIAEAFKQRLIAGEYHDE